MEKLLAKRFFEFGDLHAQRRLNDVELAGRAGDVSFLREAEEILHLLDIHDGLRFRGGSSSSF
jgi:hypothetical protein